jgi:hypothetical protein
MRRRRPISAALLLRAMRSGVATRLKPTFTGVFMWRDAPTRAAGAEGAMIG